MLNDQNIQEIIQSFQEFNDWEDKYIHLIKMGKDIGPFDDNNMVDKNIVKGCQSVVYLHAYFDDGKVNYEAHTDSVIVRGLVYLILRFYSGHDPKFILEEDPRFIQEIGLDKHLSANRTNGLLAMIKQIKLYAQVFYAMSKVK
jgi:cysteine desulfuration protein SufE